VIPITLCTPGAHLDSAAVSTQAGLRWFFIVSAVLALIAGVMLFIGAAETDRFFAWTIEPPLTAAFMGAAFWAALVLLAWAANQREWVRSRTALPAVFLIAVLLLVATLIHLDKFDFDSLFGWFWLTVYVIVVPLLAVLIWQQNHRQRHQPHPSQSGLRPSAPGQIPGAGEVPRSERPLPAWLRLALSLQAGAMLGIGAALFAFGTDAASLWPWELTPLTARAIGAFLCGFGIAAAFAVREDDLDRLRGSALSYAALGALELLAVAIHSEDLSGSDLEQGLYIGFCASVLAIGAYGVWASRTALSGAPSARSASA
jgi:uncharacterized integral membrane protein